MEDAYDWPQVTIQLPIFNERHVVERLIDACAAMHYPRARLQMQVLDDSTDLTSMLIQRRVQQLQDAGYRVEHLQRADRTGYKAGALAHALASATGDFIVIFDADFAPPPDFLLQTLPHFQQDERIGFVQARWGHLNYEYSPITRSQALALDGHFLVEQAGRQAAGYAFGFNGSAGVWRRACIEDEQVGGWHIDTLCEDLDLSYRAQLAGWRPLFVNYVVAPAEIPPQLSGFKRQQFRWAKGSIQTLLKCAPHIRRSSWPLDKNPGRHSFGQLSAAPAASNFAPDFAAADPARCASILAAGLSQRGFGGTTAALRRGPTPAPSRRLAAALGPYWRADLAGLWAVLEQYHCRFTGAAAALGPVFAHPQIPRAKQPGSLAE
ncbi:MAG: glycosyltransferase [Caldilineaceae bacterium]